MPGKPPKDLTGFTPNGTKQVAIPDKFNLFEESDATLSVIEQFVGYVLSSGVKSIHIDQSQVEHLGHGAETLLSVLGQEASQDLGLALSGKWPLGTHQRRIVRAAGLPRVVTSRDPLDEDFLVMPLQVGTNRFKSLLRRSDKEVAGENLVRYLNQCLENYGYCLTEVATDRLTSMVTEVMENAETHSGKPQWWISAYTYFNPHKRSGDCHVAVIGFGKAIAESLMELPEGSPLRLRIDSLVARHHSRGFFNATWTEENLWTLYALQESVSRLRDEAGHTNLTRGVGLMDLVDFFLWFGPGTGGNGPRMSILSGNTRIIVDKNSTITTTPHGLREVALNKSNSLQSPPSPGTVSSTKRRFPGTAISIEFSLDKSHLDSSAGGGE